MNSHQLKLSGTFELPNPLEIDKNYGIFADVDIVSISKASQEDGSFEFVYSAKPTIGEVKMPNGEVIKLVDKKKQSVKLRQQLGFIAKDRGLNEQEFYETTMVKIRHYLLEILDLVEGLEK